MIAFLLLLAAADADPRQVLMPVEEHRRFVAEASRELGLTTVALQTCKEEKRAVEQKLEARTPAALDALVLPPSAAPEEGSWTGLEVLGVTAATAVLAAAAGVVAGVVMSP